MLRNRLFAVLFGLAVLALANPAHAQTTYTWNLNAAGTWDTATTNWLTSGSPATYVSTNGNIASFGEVITASRAIAVAAGGVTGGQINFTNVGSFAYTIGTAANNITMNNSGADEQINVGRGNIGTANYQGVGGHTITGSNITFTNNLVITNNGAFGATDLTIAGAIARASNGGSITVGGQGTTTISGAIGSSITGGIIKNGSGTLNLTSATNAF